MHSPEPRTCTVAISCTGPNLRRKRQMSMKSRPAAILACLFILLTATVPRAAAAAAYLIADDQTGHILAAGSPNAKRQIASLTKVATALVVLDWAEKTKTSLGTMAVVPQSALRIGGSNPCGLTPGDTVSLRDLLYAALVQSDNHAAHTLANHVGAKLPNYERLGPVDNFTAHMNALARSLGMKRTLFLNPHGLDNTSGTLPHSTAADLARLTRYAYDHAGFHFYVSQSSREITITGPDGTPRAFLLQNTNQLLGQAGIDGVKTGRSARAGDCLILSSERPPEVARTASGVNVTPRRILVVLLGSPDRFGEGLAAIRRGWNLYDAWAAKGRPHSKKSSL